MASDCPICLGNEISIFQRGIFDCDVTVVRECAGCGVQFLDPMMSQEEENAYYRDYYQKQKSRQFTDLSLDDIQSRALLHYEKFRDIYSAILVEVERLLEIGSGTGGFVRFVRTNFPHIEVVALERDLVNREFIRKSCQNTQCVENIEGIKERRFDAICGFGVFEHLRDGLGFLREVQPLLRNGGVLALNVPNKEHALVYDYSLEEFKRFTYMKQHYFSYTEKAFELLASKSGFRTKKFNYMQVWGLDNHLSWLRYRAPRDFSDITRLLSRETIDSYARDLMAAKKSDLMMAVLEKVSE